MKQVAIGTRIQIRGINLNIVRKTNQQVWATVLIDVASVTCPLKRYHTLC